MMKAFSAEPSNLTKACLDCSTQIPVAASKCPHCQEWQLESKRHKVRAWLRSIGEWIFGLCSCAFFGWIIIGTYLRNTATEELRKRQDDFVKSAAWNQIREVQQVNVNVPVFLELEYDSIFFTAGTFTAESTIAADEKEFFKAADEFLGRHNPTIFEGDNFEFITRDSGVLDVKRKVVVKFPKG